MCYVTGWLQERKESHEVCYPSNPRIWPQSTDHSSNCYFCMVDPTKRRTGKNAPQIVYPDIPSSIAPVSHCPRAACSHSSEEGSAIFMRQQQVRQWGRYWRSRLRFHRCVEERRPYLTRKTSTIWSETLVLPSPMLSFWYPGSNSGTCWMKAYKSKIKESVTKHFPTSSVGKMLLQQCGRSIRGCRYHM